MFKWLFSSEKNKSESGSQPSEEVVTPIGRTEKISEPTAGADEVGQLLNSKLKLKEEEIAQLTQNLSQNEQVISHLVESLKEKEEDLVRLHQKQKHDDNRLSQTQHLLMARNRDVDLLEQSSLRRIKKDNLLRLENATLKREIDQIVEKNQLMMNQREIADKELSLLRTWNMHEVKDANRLIETYQGLVHEIETSASFYYSNKKILEEIDSRQGELCMDKKRVERGMSQLKRERDNLVVLTRTLRASYPDYEFWLLHKDLVKEDLDRLTSWNRNVIQNLASKENEIELFLQKSDELDLLKDGYEREKEAFECEQRRLKQEERRLRIQEARMYDYAVNVQRKLYEEIEKNERVLFIIRSLAAMDPFYGQVVAYIASHLKGKRVQYIVAGYLQGKSFYDIGQELDMPSTLVRRTYWVAIGKLHSLTKKKPTSDSN